MKQGRRTVIQFGSIPYSVGVPSWQPLSQLIPSNCSTKNRSQSKNHGKLLQNTNTYNCTSESWNFCHKALECLVWVFKLFNPMQNISHQDDTSSFSMQGQMSPKKDLCLFLWCCTSQRGCSNRKERLREFAKGWKEDPENTAQDIFRSWMSCPQKIPFNTFDQIENF